MRQSRTLGSVRGGDGAATVTPTRARSRKRWIHAKGKPTAATGPLLLGNIEPIILKNKIEDVREVGAPESYQVDDAKTGTFVRLMAPLLATRQPVEMSSNRPG